MARRCQGSGESALPGTCRHRCAQVPSLFGCRNARQATCASPAANARGRRGDAGDRRAGRVEVIRAWAAEGLRQEAVEDPHAGGSTMRVGTRTTPAQLTPCRLGRPSGHGLKRTWTSDPGSVPARALVAHPAKHRCRTTQPPGRRAARSPTPRAPPPRRAVSGHPQQHLTCETPPRRPTPSHPASPGQGQYGMPKLELGGFVRGSSGGSGVLRSLAALDRRYGRWSAQQGHRVPPTGGRAILRCGAGLDDQGGEQTGAEQHSVPATESD